MTLQTQFRRSAFSMAILIVLGGFVAVEGQAFADPQAADETLIAGCSNVDESESESTAASGGGSPARGDWRALLPAMIAR